MTRFLFHTKYLQYLTHIRYSMFNNKSTGDFSIVCHYFNNKTAKSPNRLSSAFWQGRFAGGSFIKARKCQGVTLVDAFIDREVCVGHALFHVHNVQDAVPTAKKEPSACDVCQSVEIAAVIIRLRILSAQTYILLASRSIIYRAFKLTRLQPGNSPSLVEQYSLTKLLYLFACNASSICPGQLITRIQKIFGLLSYGVYYDVRTCSRQPGSCYRRSGSHGGSIRSVLCMGQTWGNLNRRPVCLLMFPMTAGRIPLPSIHYFGET